jgi:ribosomal protein S12 methylthiotransferase
MKTKRGEGLINIVTLGCSKNLVDSEQLARQLDANNLRVLHDSDKTDARTVVINTCGFINDAKEESVNTILNFVEARKKGQLDHVYVMGCLSERYKKDLQHEIPEVDEYFGANNLEDIVKTLGGNLKHDLLGERQVTTPNHYAYLKISEGCDRTCSFCAIPLMRGKHRSKPLELVLNEAENLVTKGAKELILIAQDLTYYGIDLYKEQKLNQLLLDLSSISGLEWIRLHYAYPTGFPKEILHTIHEKENICSYLDIPFQHINDQVLKNMRRGISKKHTYELIDAIKKNVPHISLRTTLLTGFPGETKEAFNDLLQFVEEIRFDRLGVFTYSEEESTFGARNFNDDIPEEVKKYRAEEVMSRQQMISRDMNQKKIGTETKVLLDRSEGDYFIGRTESDSPEVDNEVLIKNTRHVNIQPGEFHNVKITDAEDYDLFGEIIE